MLSSVGVELIMIDLNAFIGYTNIPPLDKSSINLDLQCMWYVLSFLSIVSLSLLISK